MTMVGEDARDFLQAALGPDIMAALSQDDVTEIYVNPDGALWVEDFAGRHKTDVTVPSVTVEMIIRVVASKTGQSATSENPSIAADLPGLNQRFQGVLMQQSFHGPTIDIRKKSTRIITLAGYVDSGMMESATYDSIKTAVLSHQNILVIGGTGTGKTTFANALLRTIAEASETPDRCLILEDTPELTYPGPDVVYMKTSEGRSMRALVRDSLRMRPDRIIIGEVRDGSAYDMLKAWNTGHPGGVATIHANTPQAGLTRLEDLILEATTHINQHQIADTINVVVHIEGRGAERHISTIAAVKGYENNAYILEQL